MSEATAPSTGSSSAHPPAVHAQVPTVRAAEYVRMSTDNQNYSVQNQSKTIRQYATPRGIEIVRTYADEARAELASKGATPCNS